MKTYTEKELRELEAWIAEHVMGYEERQCYNGSQRIEGQTFWVCKGRQVVAPSFNGKHRFPPFATDPAAAMQVLEKCAEMLRKDCNSVEILRNTTGWAVCSLYRDGFGHEEHDTVEAETLPLAICLFARKLFGEITNT